MLGSVVIFLGSLRLRLLRIERINIVLVVAVAGIPDGWVEGCCYCLRIEFGIGAVVVVVVVAMKHRQKNRLEITGAAIEASVECTIEMSLVAVAPQNLLDLAHSLLSSLKCWL